MDLNNIVMVGRIARDVEYTPAQNGKNSRAIFVVTVNRAYKAEGRPTHDNFRCVAWGKTADACAKYLKRGKQVTVRGEGNNYPVEVTLQDGTKRTFNMFEINVDRVRFGHDSMKEQSGGSTGGMNFEAFANLLKQKGLLDDKDISGMGTQNTNTNDGDVFYGDDISSIFGDK